MINTVTAEAWVYTYSLLLLAAAQPDRRMRKILRDRSGQYYVTSRMSSSSLQFDPSNWFVFFFFVCFFFLLRLGRKTPADRPGSVTVTCPL